MLQVSCHSNNNFILQSTCNILCTHIGLISSHLTQSGLDGTLLHIPCTHIGLISNHLTQSDLDCTLLHIPCTQMIDFQPFETIRFVPYPPSHPMHTRRIDFQPFDNRVWTVPSSTSHAHIGLISRHLTQSGLDRTLLLHAMHTHSIDFQQFDTIRFGLYPPPHTMHTDDWFPAIWNNQVCTVPSFTYHAHT